MIAIELLYKLLHKLEDELLESDNTFLTIEQKSKLLQNNADQIIIDIRFKDGERVDLKAKVQNSNLEDLKNQEEKDES